MRYMRASRHGRRDALLLAMGIAAAVISFGVATGLKPTTPTSTAPLTVISGQVLDLGNVFGNVKPVEIKGVKFEDLNGNGVHDPGEPPMAGIPIQLAGKMDWADPSTLSPSLMPTAFSVSQT